MATICHLSAIWFFPIKKSRFSAIICTQRRVNIDDLFLFLRRVLLHRDWIYRKWPGTILRRPRDGDRWEEPVGRIKRAVMSAAKQRPLLWRPEKTRKQNKRYRLVAVPHTEDSRQLSFEWRLEPSNKSWFSITQNKWNLISFSAWEQWLMWCNASTVRNIYLCWSTHLANYYILCLFIRNYY